MKDKPQQYRRINRICFRTTRSVAAGINDVAHDFGFNRSQMVHWLCESMMSRLLQVEGWQQRAAIMHEWFGPTGSEQFMKEVDKGLHDPDPDAVPW